MSLAYGAQRSTDGTYACVTCKPILCSQHNRNACCLRNRAACMAGRPCRWSGTAVFQRTCSGLASMLTRRPPGGSCRAMRAAPYLPARHGASTVSKRHMGRRLCLHVMQTHCFVPGVRRQGTHEA